MKKRLIELGRGLIDRIRRQPKRAAVAGVLLLVVVTAGVRMFRHAAVVQNNYYTVKRRDFLISIVEGGTLKAVQEVTVRNELEGTSRILSIVPEGTSVKSGDLLVELDSSDLRDRLSAQEVVYQNVQFAFLQAKETLAIQKSLAESNIKDAELKLEFAASDLEKYKEGDMPQLKKNTQSRITIATEELSRAQERIHWTKELQKKGYATKSDLDADELAVKRSDISLEQATEDLRLFEKYDFPKKIRQLEAGVESAQKELERIKLRSLANIAAYEADLKSRQSTLDLQETRLNQLKEQLNLTRIVAPQDGMVVYASSSNPGSGVLIEEGATVRQKQDIIKLPDVSQMMIEIRVHESHVQKIKSGLSAFVTIDSIPDRQFRGVVRKVAVLPDSSSRYYNPNLKVYTTEVVIEDKIGDMKPGISGRAEIVITNLYKALTVPIQTVTSVKGKQVCFIDRGAGPVPVEVEVGLYNDKLIEIKKGLAEGDRVLLSPLSNSDNIDMSGSFVNEDEADAANKAAVKRGEDAIRSNAQEKKPAKAEPKRQVPANPYLQDPVKTPRQKNTDHPPSGKERKPAG